MDQDRCVCVHAAARHRWDGRANETPIHTAEKNFTLGGIYTWLVHMPALHGGKNRMGIDKGVRYMPRWIKVKGRCKMMNQQSYIASIPIFAYMHIHGQSVNP